MSGLVVGCGRASTETPLRRATGAAYPAALADLTARHRRARGALRRLLASRLIIEHEPLMLLIVDGMCGRQAPGTKRQRRMPGCQGMEDIEREDAMQSARIACALALEQFDPRKGRAEHGHDAPFGPYLKLKIRHEMQRRALRETWRAKVPLGRELERPEVDLLETGDREEWDLAAGSSAPDVVEGLDAFGAEDLERWQASGEWPESLEQLAAAQAPVVDRDLKPENLMERFLAGLLFVPHGRVPRVTLLGRWQALGGHDERPVRQMLEARGVRVSSMRVEWSDCPVPAFAGTTIRRAQAA